MKVTVAATWRMDWMAPAWVLEKETLLASCLPSPLPGPPVLTRAATVVPSSAHSMWLSALPSNFSRQKRKPGSLHYAQNKVQTLRLAPKVLQTPPLSPSPVSHPTTYPQVPRVLVHKKGLWELAGSWRGKARGRRLQGCQEALKGRVSGGLDGW